ncbi:MAG: flagellin, partial [Lachnospiraceae bacterium]|nr:flagellin [Lachnospiraceae bacterium]
MRISYNASAAIATNQLNRNDNRLQQSLGRLSSGLKIVNAKDNPSGLAMSKRMNAQIKGIDQATQNASDGVSIIEIADGSLSEIHDMLQRINELSVKSNNGILTDDDRRLIDAEVQQLMEEITRISSETEFNGQKLLDGSFDLKGYTDQENVKVTYYSDAIKSGIYNISLTGVTFKADGTIDEVGGFTGGPEFPADAEISQIDGNMVTIKGSQGFELKLHIEDGGSSTINATMDLVGFGAMDL